MGLILRLGDVYETRGDSDFPFDREIHLDVKYSMLREDYWDEAERIIEPLLKKMYATMKSDVEESSDDVSEQ
ncbi:hypothetical protein [Pseudomonas fragi]|uniref:hypothetical protein n=1 Tax=Pseudomonas fragi TaxID=296 RepID=UPI00159627D8|nr:hypothetical protein [Pseudomonas fragi]